MWIDFKSIEYRKDIKSKAGNTFDGYILSGNKRGYQDDPDDPNWEKVLFDSQAVTVIERGVARPNQSLVGYLQTVCKEGDLLALKSEKRGRFWEITTIENLSENKPQYTPLTEEEFDKLRAQQAAVPTPPAATRQSAPVSNGYQQQPNGTFPNHPVFGSDDIPF